MSEFLDVDPVTLARLHELHPDLNERVARSPALGVTASAVINASRFLTRHLLVEPSALDVLDSLDVRPPIEPTGETLVGWKNLELLRIAARDLVGIDDVEAVGDNLAQLAEDVLAAASTIAEARETLTIVGMGKLGGRELNYASDVDIMFVGEGDDALARRVIEIARRCFRIDVNLRPEGRDGPLVRSIESYVKYWDTWAQPWEFQALLKARVVCEADGSTRWMQAAETALWSRPFGADELRSLREMKARSEHLVERKGLTDREVKRGRGGIRDIEFAVQLLQLVHGRRDPSIRSRNSLQALEDLARGGYVATQDAQMLADSYRFLRNVEHRLQLVESEQTHTVPVDRSERELIARALGFVSSPERDAVDTFDERLRTEQSKVRDAHEKLYFRPLLEAFASDHLDDHSSLAERLTAFGFTDANRTREAIVELTRGLTRSSRLMQQMMPLLLDWLSGSPDPDQGLLGLRTLVEGFHTPAQVVTLFRESPEAARRLCLLLGTSTSFARGLARQPDLLSELADDRSLLPDSPVLERARAATAWSRGRSDRLSALRRFAQRELIAVAASDVLGLVAATETGVWTSALAEAVLQTTIDEIDPAVPVALIGLGRFGGDEMSYASDLDVIVVHGGTTQADQLDAEDVAQQLLRYVSDPSPARRIYQIDYDLRPEGKKGLLARSLTSCADYYRNWAETWERQALIRARFVAGDRRVGSEFLDVTHQFVWERGLDAEDERQIRHLKARMENERIPRGEDAGFHLKLGRGSLSDVEWTVQLLQLRHNVEGTNTLRALDTIRRSGLIDESDANVLEDAWTFCDRVRRRWFLVSDGTTDSLPTNQGRLAVLARSLGMSPPELRETYLRSTRRCRAVVERVFYGKEPA